LTFFNFFLTFLVQLWQGAVGPNLCGKKNKLTPTVKGKIREAKAFLFWECLPTRRCGENNLLRFIYFTSLNREKET
jgi:hypothetical protein